MKNLAIQAIGFIGLFFVALSFQNKQRKGILLFQMLASVFYVIHFLLLGALTGFIMNLISIARCYVFYNKEKEWASKKIWLYFFMVLATLGAVFTWKNSFSILPMIGMCVGTASFWMNNPKHIRLLILISPPCWFTYNLISGSIAGMITEIFSLTSVVIGIIRFDIMKPSSKNDCSM